MKIVIDEAIPFIKGIFEPFAEVCYMVGGDFSAEAVKDADALIIRTRSRCDSSLLDGSSVRLIATATIGYDHIDMEYCRQRGIEVTTAAGCNARGVLQWVAATLVKLSEAQGGWHPSQRRLGVVGVGNVGRLVEEYGRLWGFDVVCCDPPRARLEGGEGAEEATKFISFEELISECDIITFHTPLDHSTRHMLNEQSIKLLKPNATIINSSRGEVIDSAALRHHPTVEIAFDVWEGEPNMCSELLQRAIVATPHIAGYSLQGKANGTASVVNSVAQRFNIPLVDWYPETPKTVAQEISWAELQHTIKQHFDIDNLSQRLKQNPIEFEPIRNHYNYREEYF